MKKIIMSTVLLIGLLTNLNAQTTKECITDSQRIGFGLLGVLQGTIIGGPIGAFWGLGITVYASEVEKDCNELNRTGTAKIDEKTIISNIQVRPEEKVVQIEKVKPEIQDTHPTEKIAYVSAFNFKFDSTEIVKTTIDLKSIVKKRYGKKIIILGHTCTIGKEQYNEGLGFRRASVVAQLLYKMGVPKENIEIISKGETSPISDKLEENRRVDVSVID